MAQEVFFPSSHLFRPKAEATHTFCHNRHCRGVNYAQQREIPAFVCPEPTAANPIHWMP